MKRVYVINGPAGTGKDTFIGLVRTLLNGQRDVLTFSSVDEVKLYLINNENWDGVTKDSYWRLRMHEVKKQMVADGDRPTQYMIERIAEAPENSIIFLHIREAEEILKLKALLDQLRTIHLDREGVERYSNPADANTLTLEYDHYIRNDGTLDDFAEVARQFILRDLVEELSEGEQTTFSDLR
jgi:hypothetical protein